MPQVQRAYQRTASAIARALKAAALELRDSLRENGSASWSRYGSCAIVCTWCFVVVRTRAIPERTEQAAYLLAALYGVNQLKQMVQAYRDAKAQAPVADPAPAPPQS